MTKPFHPDDLASEAYRETLRDMHGRAPWGNKGFKYSQEIREFCYSLFGVGADNFDILDYGCGLETFKNDNLDLDVRGYDPGIPGLDEMPKPAAVVICTDVLEHIEPDLIYNVLRHIAELARVGIYLHIATTPAKRELPDGRNAHLITEGAEWWETKLSTISDRWTIREIVPGRKSVKFYLVRARA